MAPLWARLRDFIRCEDGADPPLSLAGLVASVYLRLGSGDALLHAGLWRGLIPGRLCWLTSLVVQAGIADVAATPRKTRARGMGHRPGLRSGFGFIIRPVHRRHARRPPAPMLGARRLFARLLASRRWSSLRTDGLSSRKSESPLTRNAARQEPPRRDSDGDDAAAPALFPCCSPSSLSIFAFAGMETTFALWAMAQFGSGPRPGRRYLRL